MFNKNVVLMCELYVAQYNATVYCIIRITTGHGVHTDDIVRIEEVTLVRWLTILPVMSEICTMNGLTLCVFFKLFRPRPPLKIQYCGEQP